MGMRRSVGLGLGFWFLTFTLVAADSLPPCPCSEGGYLCSPHHIPPVFCVYTTRGPLVETRVGGNYLLVWAPGGPLLLLEPLISLQQFLRLWANSFLRACAVAGSILVEMVSLPSLFRKGWCLLGLLASQLPCDLIS